MKKTADEMFEELGYRKYDNKKVKEIRFIKQMNKTTMAYISFHKTLKKIEVYFYDSEARTEMTKPILMEELQAINKKCEELRMDIEEAIKKLNKFNEYENAVVLTEDALYEIQDAIETILKELENSIPKEKIEKYLKEEKERFEVYKKESKTNENLKPGMFRHLKT